MREEAAVQDIPEYAIGDAAYTAKKNRWKIYRAIFEILLIAVILVGVVQLFFTLRTYESFAESSRSSEDHGFIALSYFGVDRIGDTGTRIGKEQLRAHLDTCVHRAM